MFGDGSASRHDWSDKSLCVTSDIHQRSKSYIEEIVNIDTPVEGNVTEVLFSSQ